MSIHRGQNQRLTRHFLCHKEKEKEREKESNVAVLKNLIAVFCYPLVSKFMRCFSENKL